MERTDVAVLMGSASDWPAVRPATEILRTMGLSFEVHVTSAHRTPERTVKLVRRAEEAGVSVFICAAGMAAHLAGAVAALTTRPVLGVPLAGGVLDGVDALLSTVQMPPGIPVATFAVGTAGAKNAAHFAAQIVATKRSEIEAAIDEQRARGVAKVEAGEAAIAEELGGAS